MTSIQTDNLPLVTEEATLMEALAVIDKYARGIALVVESDQRLIGTVSDGDIRREILGGGDLQSSVSQLLSNKASSNYPKPITAEAASSWGELLTLMHVYKLRQVPLLDKHSRVVDLIMQEDLITGDVPPDMEAVIMAGGLGSRLRPLTENMPKPMLPVGDRPLMEKTVEQLREAGVKQISVTTHYMPEKITDYFGDGSKFGVDISYLAEEQPMGTAGGLAAMATGSSPILVINGDVVTGVDFRAILDFHREHKADMTIGVRQYTFKVPYGVVESRGPEVTQITEKPDVSFFVNAGIYIIEPSIKDMIPQDRRYDMTDLAHDLMEKGGSVVSFPIVEYWLDIGQPADYEKAQKDAQSSETDC